MIRIFRENGTTEINYKCPSCGIRLLFVEEQNYEISGVTKSKRQCPECKYNLNLHEVIPDFKQWNFVEVLPNS